MVWASAGPALPQSNLIEVTLFGLLSVKVKTPLAGELVLMGSQVVRSAVANMTMDEYAAVRVN